MSKSMIKVQYFASVREALGRDGEQLEVPDGILDVEQVIDALVARHGDECRRVLRDGAVLVAVNQRMTKRSARVDAGDEVAFFPPVTGG